jgi:hypothetical protein
MMAELIKWGGAEQQWFGFVAAHSPSFVGVRRD